MIIFVTFISDISYRDNRLLILGIYSALAFKIGYFLNIKPIRLIVGIMVIPGIFEQLVKNFYREYLFP
jgi:hypothetical protein